MASAMCSSEEETPRRSRLSGSLASARASPLQRAVHIAIHRTVCACESCESSSRSEFRRTFNQLSHVMPRSNLLATKEPDVSNNNLSGASPTGVADLFAGDSSGVKTAQITQPQPLIRRLPSCSRCQDTSVPIKSSQVRVSEDSLTDALCIEEGARLALEIDLVMDQLATEILATRWVGLRREKGIEMRKSIRFYIHIKKWIKILYNLRANDPRRLIQPYTKWNLHINVCVCKCVCWMDSNPYVCDWWLSRYCDCLLFRLYVGTRFTRYLTQQLL